MPAPTFLSIVEFPGDGVTTEWDFNFAGGYIRQEHVKALVRDEFGAPTDLTLTPDDFITATRLQVTPAVPSGHTLRIYRETPREEPLVNFTNGSNFTEANLDILAKQVVFCAAEAFDAGAYAEAFDLLGQAQTAASQAADALAAAIESQTESALSEAAAALSAASAATSASTATTQADIATTQATNATTQKDQAVSAKVAAESALASAQTARDTAIAQATTATTKASEASASAAAALVSQNDAAASASSAATSATTATTKATEAAASAAAAALFEPTNFISKVLTVPANKDVAGLILPSGTDAQRPTVTSGVVLRGGQADVIEAVRSTGTQWLGLVAATPVSLVGVLGVEVDIPPGVRQIHVLVDAASHNSGTGQSFGIAPLAGASRGTYRGGGSDGTTHYTATDRLRTITAASAAVFSVVASFVRVSANVWSGEFVSQNYATAAALTQAVSTIDLGAELTAIRCEFGGGLGDSGTIYVLYGG